MTARVTLSVVVEYDPRRGDPDTIASALDCLLSVGRDPDPTLQDYGVIALGDFAVSVPLDAIDDSPWGDGDPHASASCSGCVRAR